MSLVSWYRFDDDDANIGTDSQESRDMTSTGVISIAEDYGNAAYLNRSSSYLTLASGSVQSSMLGGSSRTFSCWCKPESNGVIHGNGLDNAHERWRAIYNTTNTVLDFNTST